ncbi:histidine kinase [Bacillus sp. FJAT-27231]|uniref:sensor histidine kinase n=1 Tax=Bacillus sp. FJAT-27231 TaxID=1679168 RepID=UPI00067126D8|nr:HAMP domain-containing sensor histidine kinase [Bacillus sp. FJAT-27231]KMY53085.1 histidine kinase [Bacillus sp. FJAT-27231]
MKVIKMRNNLIVKLLVAVAISFFVSVSVLAFLSQQFILHFYMKFLTEFSVAKYNFIMFFIYSIAITSFVICFLLLVHKKIKYLKLITESVQQIANGQLGLTIEARGKDELAQLAININDMSKELAGKFEHERRLESAKNELITNVSHDLRTPLTSIIGYLDLLRKGQYTSEQQLKDYLGTTYSKSKRLEYLINELFEYTKLSSPDVTLNLIEVDLTGLLEQLIGEYIPIAEKEQLRIHKTITEAKIPILLDIEKMVRVYENLLMNAINYSTKPSELRISCEADGAKAVIKVSNEVEHPPADDVNKLFERFFTGEKARTDKQGTGLGLAISKRIVELHHGMVDAEYEEGWITFIVEHPLQT